MIIIILLPQINEKVKEDNIFIHKSSFVSHYKQSLERQIIPHFLNQREEQRGTLKLKWHAKDRIRAEAEDIFLPLTS